MDFSNYKVYIRDLVENVTGGQFDDGQRFLDNCQEIIKAGTREKDLHLLGIGYYYLAEGYFRLNDYSHFNEYLIRGISYQREAGQGKLLTRSYNMMGIDAVGQGNITVALDHYLMALKYGIEYGCEYETALVYANMGQLYMNLNEFSKAAAYLGKAGKLFEKQIEEQPARRNMILIYTMLGRCYLEQGQLWNAEAMEACICKLEQEKSEQGSGNVLVEAFRVQLCHLEGREAQRDKGIAEILKSLGSGENMLESWKDIIGFGEFLLKLKKYKELNQLCDSFQDLGEQMEIVNLKKECLRLRILCFRETGKQEEYLKGCARLFEYEEMQKKEDLKMLSRSVDLRFSLEEAEGKARQLLKETSILKERSEKDALTGLPNRYKLNEYAEEIFEKAYHNKKNLGVEILDVDYFKKYNDQYGHPAGDEYLKMVGKLLREEMDCDPDIFCARYGGDEFVVIFYGKTDEEILEWAKKLKRNVIRMDKKKGVPMTISQGIRNLVPKEENRVWDYLYTADGALYEVKQKQKNGICLVHQVSSEAIDTIMVMEEEENDDI